MSGVAERFIDFGTGTDEVSSRSVPAFFTPANYIPAQVAAEGDDKTSAHLKGLDTKIGTLSSSSEDAVAAQAVVLDQLTAAGSGGQSVFSLSLNINDGMILDVAVLGKLQLEGSSAAFTRDSTANTITFNETIAEDVKVRIRAYQGFLATFDYISGSGGQTTFTTGCMKTTSVVDAWIYGKLQREGGGESFTRDASADSITFNETVPEDAEVKVRIYRGTDDVTDYDVPGGGQSSFTPDTFSADDIIDAWINGTWQREGASESFTRNVGGQTIDFSETIPEDSWVRIRITEAGC